MLYVQAHLLKTLLTIIYYTVGDTDIWIIHPVETSVVFVLTLEIHPVMTGWDNTAINVYVLRIKNHTLQHIINLLLLQVTLMIVSYTVILLKFGNRETSGDASGAKEAVYIRLYNSSNG